MKPLYREAERETVMSLCRLLLSVSQAPPRLTIWLFGKRGGRMEGKTDECTSCVSEQCVCV